MLSKLKIKIDKVKAIRILKNRHNFPYPRQLKRDILEYIKESKDSTASICRFLGLNQDRLYKWIEK